jgi:hypothetical protein
MACIYCDGCNWNGGFTCGSRSACAEFDLSDDKECKDCDCFKSCDWRLEEKYALKLTIGDN